jgi:hypothetical protein
VVLHHLLQTKFQQNGRARRVRDNVGAFSSSNRILSLPQSSSSTFPSLSNQSDTHRKEDQEIYDDSKDDIAD